MHTVVKGGSLAIASLIAYMNHTFSPFIWLLIGLVVLDLILNATDESKQLQKIGSSFATVTTTIFLKQGTTVLQVPNLPEIFVLALTVTYLGIVIPQVVHVFKVLQPKATASEIAFLKAELAKMQATAQKDLNQSVQNPTSPISMKDATGG